MKDWLAKLAEQTKSEDEVLHDVVDNLPKSQLQELVYDLDYTQRPTQMDDMQAKIAEAERHGRELAHEHGDELEKQALAFLAPLAMGAARMAGGQALKGGLKSMAGSVAKNVAKDTVINGATRAVSNAVRPPQQAMQPAAQGGFNYGKFAGLNLAGMGRQAAGFLHRNPGAAVTLAGAGVGALMAPRDPQTGQKQYVRGALMGGGLAAGANALSQGRIADKAKHMVTRQNNPVLGQGARRYMTESAYMTRPGAKAAPAASAASHAAPAAPAASEAASAVSEMPRAYSNPDWQRFQQGAQEHVEMGQLRDQMASKSPQKSAPPPRPAATRVSPSFMDRFRSPASAGGAAAVPSYQGGPVGGQVKVGFVLGGIAGYGAAGPDRDASPRSGFWRGALGSIPGAIVGSGIGGAIGKAIPNAGATYRGIPLMGGNHQLAGTILGSLAGQIGGGYLAGRTARPTESEIEAHHAGELAKIKAKQKASKEKTAYLGPDQIIGGFIGHSAGKKQVERGEDHSFGGKQIASLLLPGGAGYQLGRYIAHNDEKKKQKTASEDLTDKDRARKWGRTGALVGAGFTAARIPAALGAVSEIAKQTGHRPSPGAIAAMIGAGGLMNAGVGYGVGRLAHRIKHGPATGKPLSKEANTQRLVYDPATKTFSNTNQVKLGSIFSTKISPAAAGAAVRGGVAGIGGAAASVARKPPPIPAAAATQAQAAGQRAWQNSPFKAPPARQAAPSGLAGVQSQLNSARSVAGGGPMMPSGGHATVKAMPGSGW